MRRIFLVLAMLALLVLTAMPATAQSDWWDGSNDHSWWDGGNDHGDDDKDHGDDDKDHWWGPPQYMVRLVPWLARMGSLVLSPLVRLVGSLVGS